MYYSSAQALKEIKRRAREGLVIITDHAREREEDRDIDDQEIHRCLKAGFLDGEDWSGEHQDMTYRMVMQQGTGTRLIVVVALDDTHDIVVTTFRKELK